MSLQVEKLEKNMAKLTIEVSAEDLDKAMEKAYQKQKSRIKKKRDYRKRIISQTASPHRKGIASRTAITSLITSQIESTAKAPTIIARKKGGKKERKEATA